jgi:hypothetical protein
MRADVAAARPAPLSGPAAEPLPLRRWHGPCPRDSAVACPGAGCVERDQSAVVAVIVAVGDGGLGQVDGGQDGARGLVVAGGAMARRCVSVQQQCSIRCRASYRAASYSRLRAVALGRDDRRLARLPQPGEHLRLRIIAHVGHERRGGDAWQLRVRPGHVRCLPTRQPGDCERAGRRGRVTIYAYWVPTTTPSPRDVA